MTIWTGYIQLPDGRERWVAAITEALRDAAVMRELERAGLPNAAGRTWQEYEGRGDYWEQDSLFVWLSGPVSVEGADAT